MVQVAHRPGQHQQREGGARHGTNLSRPCPVCCHDRLLNRFSQFCIYVEPEGAKSTRPEHIPGILWPAVRSPFGTVNLFWRIATEIYSLGEFQSLLHHSARCFLIPEPINSLPRRRTSLCATECSLCGEPPLQEELCRSLMASISRDRRKSSRSCVGNRRPNARSASVVAFSVPRPRGLWI